jgi:hypothetical protein
VLLGLVLEVGGLVWGVVAAEDLNAFESLLYKLREQVGGIFLGDAWVG